jgi:hypothetical protein
MVRGNKILMGFNAVIFVERVKSLREIKTLMGFSAVRFVERVIW